MNRTQRSPSPNRACEVIDFDEVLLGTCPPGRRADLLAEARLLAQAFAPGGGVSDLERIAQALSAGDHDAEMERTHARKLAAALRRLARDPWR